MFIVLLVFAGSHGLSSVSLVCAVTVASSQCIDQRTGVGFCWYLFNVFLLWACLISGQAMLPGLHCFSVSSFPTMEAEIEFFPRTCIHHCTFPSTQCFCCADPQILLDFLSLWSGMFLKSVFMLGCVRRQALLSCFSPSALCALWGSNLDHQVCPVGVILAAPVWDTLGFSWDRFLTLKVCCVGKDLRGFSWLEVIDKCH